MSLLEQLRGLSPEEVQTLLCQLGQGGSAPVVDQAPPLGSPPLQVSSPSLSSVACPAAQPAAGSLAIPEQPADPVTDDAGNGSLEPGDTFLTPNG